ncbi:MAG TPA: MFS transporter [Cellulomonas sp.]
MTTPTTDDPPAPQHADAPAGTPAPVASTSPVLAAHEPMGRRFHALLSATALANLADGVVQTAVPLYALTLTRSPGQIALLTAAAWLPWLVLGMVAGVVVDRTDRRRTQVVALTARAVLLAGAGVLVAAGRMSMPVLLAVVLVYGVTDVLVDLAQSALVPDLVPRSRLQAANGRVLAAQQVAGSFVGGPVAGLVLGLGAAWAFGLPAGLAVAAVVLVLRGVPGRYRHASTPASDPAPDPTVAAAPATGTGTGTAASRVLRRGLSEAGEGVAFLVRHPVLRPLLVAGSISNMCFTGYTAVFVLWAVGDGSRMGMEPAQFPLLGVGMAVGAVLGSLVVEPLLGVVGEVRLMLGAWTLTATLLIVPVLAPVPLAVAGAFFLIGLANTLANVLSQSMRQRLVAPAMLGRIGGAGRTLSYGLMPVGALLAGVVAEQWDLVPVLVGAVVLSLAGMCYPLLTVRQRTVDAAELAAPRSHSRPDSPTSRAETARDVVIREI